MTVQSVLTLFPETKEQQDKFVDLLVSQIENGEVDPLKAEAQIVNIEQIVKKYRANKTVQDACLNEAEKYGAKQFTLHNAKYSIKEVGVKYDYSDCNHPVYNDLCDKIKELEEQKKNIESQLKSFSKMWIYTDSDTGEVVEVYPPAKSSLTRVVVEINK